MKVVFNPFTNKLELNASAVSIATGQVAFGSGSNTIGGDNGLFWDNSNKRLGIGNTTPQEKLDVNGNIYLSSGINTLFYNKGGTSFSQSFVIQPKNTNNNGMMVLAPSGSNTESSFMLQSNSSVDTAGSKYFGFGGGFSGAPSGSWSFGSMVYASVNANSRPISFMVSNTTDGRIEAMRIDYTGKIGIGTTTPAEKLDIYGNIFIDATNHNTTTALKFGTNGSAFHQITSNRGTGEFSLRTGTGGHFLTFVTTNVERMRITPTGNIGINTTSPSQQLHVVGNGLFTGTVKVGAYTLPSTDGSSNQVLKTDGSGTLTWQNDNSNVKRYIRVNATTNGSNYAMDGTKEVVLIDYTDPCEVTLPTVDGLSDGSVFEIQYYNWDISSITINVYPEGGNGEGIDEGYGISSVAPRIKLDSNPQANTTTPLSLRIMWLASDNVWTVLQGGVFNY